MTTDLQIEEIDVENKEKLITFKRKYQDIPRLFYGFWTDV